MTSPPSDEEHYVETNPLQKDSVPTPIPTLTIILVLLIVGCLGIGYAIFWVWTDAGHTKEALEKRLVQADLSVQQTVSAVTYASGMLKADEVRNDFLLVQRRQISWGDVIHTLLNVPEGSVVDSISQSGFTLTVDGQAGDLSIANEYLTNLKVSGLFKQTQIQLEQNTPVTVAVPPADSPTTSPVADHSTSESINTPRVLSPMPPTRAFQTPSPVPRPTETLTITASTTNTVASEPKFDFALVARHSTRIEEHRTSHIRATILDENGNRIRGVTFRIESEGTPAWSSEKSNDGQQDGIVEFAVTKGVFTVRPLVEGRVQAAVGLVTGYSDVPGKQEWELVWRRVQAGDPPPESPTNTTTATQTPTPTTPPRWAGRNIARLGSATASRGDNTAHLAIDGNLETIWQSGGFPIQEVVITLNDLYRKSEIDGFELVVAQSSVGRTTHQIWVEDEAGDIHGHTTELTSITRDRQTLIVRWDPRSVGDAESIGRVFIRTVSGSSWVGWREIRIYEKLPPPRSTMTPTRTSTATSTATMCPVEVCTATPTNTSTIVATPTASVTPTVTTRRTATGTKTVAPTVTATVTVTAIPTVTVTPTLTATPTITPTPTAIAVGQNVATRGRASSSAGSESVQNAIDGDVETTWQSGAAGVQEIVIDLDDRYRVDAVALVVSQSSPGQTSHEVWVNGMDGSLALVATATGQTVDRQTVPLHFNPAIVTDRLIVRTIRSSGNVAWREIRVFEQLPPPLSTFTPTRTHTPPPSPSPTLISAGRNVAPFGSASASSGTESASLAIDNDPETLWQANGFQHIEIELDAFYTIEAIALVVAQPVAGSTTHQVLIHHKTDGWMLRDPLLQGETLDRQTLAVLLDPAVEINKVRVKTTDAPGDFGWREIRIFEKIPPTPEPSDNLGDSSELGPSSQGNLGVAQSGILPNVSSVFVNFLRLVAGNTARALAAPATQEPIDGSTQMGLRFRLVLELEPGSGYRSK